MYLARLERRRIEAYLEYKWLMFCEPTLRSYQERYDMSGILDTSWPRTKQFAALKSTQNAIFLYAHNGQSRTNFAYADFVYTDPVDESQLLFDDALVSGTDRTKSRALCRLLKYNAFAEPFSRPYEDSDDEEMHAKLDHLTSILSEDDGQTPTPTPSESDLNLIFAPWYARYGTKILPRFRAYLNAARYTVAEETDAFETYAKTDDDLRILHTVGDETHYHGLSVRMPMNSDCIRKNCFAWIERPGFSVHPWIAFLQWHAAQGFTPTLFDDPRLYGGYVSVLHTDRYAVRCHGTPPRATLLLRSTDTPRDFFIYADDEDTRRAQANALKAAVQAAEEPMRVVDFGAIHHIDAAIPSDSQDTWHIFLRFFIACRLHIPHPKSTRAVCPLQHLNATRRVYGMGYVLCFDAGVFVLQDSRQDSHQEKFKGQTPTEPEFRALLRRVAIAEQSS